MTSSGLLAGQRVEEVGGEAQRRIGLDDVWPLRSRSKRGDDGRGLRHQAHAFALLASVDISCACGSYRLSMETAVRSTSIGMAFWFDAQEVDHLRGNGAARGQILLQLGPVRALLGSVPFQSRKMTSSKVALSARVWMLYPR